MTFSIAIESYAIAAFAFLVLSCFLLVTHRGRKHGVALAVASLLTAVWATTIAFNIDAGTPFSIAAVLTELARNAGWTAFLLTLLYVEPHSNPYQALRKIPAAMAVVCVYLVFLVITVLSYAEIDSAGGGSTSTVLDIERIALAVLGMLLVEQLYRNTPARKRWGIKLACLGIGMLFAYDFYLYSDAMLFRRINPEIWSARGMVSALAVPLIAVSVFRNSQWPVGLSVSRTLVFHSAAFFGSGVYLLAMAGAGYYLRFFGGRWGTVMQVAFLAGTLLLLAVILFSGSFRAWLKVFISKHFFHYTYDYREEWIRFTKKLSRNGQGLGECAIQAMADLVESRSGVLYIRSDSSEFRPAASWVMAPPAESEREDGDLCRFLSEKQWVIDIAEVGSTPGKYGNLKLPPWLLQQSQARLVVPLMLRERLFGFIVLGKTRSSLSLNWEVTDLLKIAGSQVASYLAQEASSDALAVARQFESFNRMSAFVVHDLKNVVAQMSLLMSNAEQHKRNPRFQDDMVLTIGESVQKMTALLERLSRGTSPETTSSVDLEQLLQKVISRMAYAEPRPRLQVTAPGIMIHANPERLDRVLGHMIQNAIDATHKDGTITVRLLKNDRSAVIELEDTGHGMTQDFIKDRLFRPFVSTKSAGMGIGMFESHSYVNELGGRIEVVSQVSVGTLFRITLPLQKFDAGRVLNAA